MNNANFDTFTMDVDDLSEQVRKAFGRFNVDIRIPRCIPLNNQVLLEIKFKGHTREAHLYARAADVQSRLRLPVFKVFKHKFTTYIAVSDREQTYPHLPAILSAPDFQEKTKGKALPYVVGFGVLGNPVIVDLAKFPHLLVGGATNSGKSVGLQALISSIVCTRSPSQASLILIDVGASSLIPFAGLPHLSYPIIRDHSAACQALVALKAEMDRRVELQTVDVERFKQLPRLVIVVDELPSLLNSDKQMSKLIAHTISSLLQRGRHAKIHLVLAAQNPTFQHMRGVDLGNITARIAFRCAKKNNSEVILGEGGAENLSGQGDMLLKAPQFDGPQRIQGVYISPGELDQLLRFKRLNPRSPQFGGFKLKLPAKALSDTWNDTGVLSSKESPSADDALLGQVAMWTLGQDCISCNKLCEDFHIGWKRAKNLLTRLHSLEIVEDVYARLPRMVLPRSIEDIPAETVALLEQSGIAKDELVAVLERRLTK